MRVIVLSLIFATMDYFISAAIYHKNETTRNFYILLGLGILTGMILKIIF